ncbi:membrane protein [Clostridia bacterium]|nr:membrane protein [Clostridia bacterium]
MTAMMIMIFLIIDIFIVLAFAFTPYVTRKTELFGVSLPAKERGLPELKKLCASFRNISLIIGAVFFGAVFAAAYAEKQELRQVFILTVGLLLYLAVSFLIYLRYHNHMKRFKEGQSWKIEPAALIIDTEPAVRDNLSARWLLLYPLIAAVTAIALFALWPSLPGQIPIHADITGAIDGWINKDSGAFVTLLWPQWMLLAVFAATYLMIRVSKRQIDASDPIGSREQGRRFRKIVGGGMIFGGTVLSVGISAIMLVMATGASIKFVMLSPFVILACTIALTVILYVRVGQGGSRLRIRGKSTQGGAANVDDDRYWKAGVFYYNKNDPAFIVEKRFGIGWTMNFAHPAAIIIIIATVLVIVGSVWIMAA